MNHRCEKGAYRPLFSYVIWRYLYFISQKGGCFFVNSFFGLR
ncbi:hypothetical protein [Klebsiella phage vB_KpnS-VAC112]|uniref:Uncharacterized protein n=2 Tax=Webervirus TaxID=1920860 RepID=A0A8K1YYY4_9CAUD|nr:hypothetical protein [Klebsiella phage vB_Kpn-VAC111]UEW68245.1 hypothetical protein [Klebsiella phage vB_KpnS-VAC112]